ncbi:MAG: diaminopimelate epimerase, partial [Clostridia bacterium]|nr:diaminopimelate epimerase [Clostridia bacterium]
CVTFVDHVEAVDLDRVGPCFENAPIFPQRVNAEFVHVVNPTTLRMRCFERGSGETMACGTGACAAVVAAVENGLCVKDMDVQVQVLGGNLLVRYSDDTVTLTGNAEMVYEAETSY